MFARIRSKLTYANVVATLALFLALGGGAYAAFKLPKNSVGSKQIKKNAVNSSKVANGSLLAGDFKPGQLPAGPPGLNGDKGDACLASDPGCRGPKGDAGLPGPGTLTFEGQFPVDASTHTIATSNGVTLSINCDSGHVAVLAQRIASDESLLGWGFQAVDGAVSIATPFTDINGRGVYIGAQATSNVQIEADVRSSTVSKLAHVDILGVRGGACNYHALVIPPP